MTVCILYMANTLYWANKTALLLCTADIFSTAAYVVFIQTSQWIPISLIFISRKCEALAVVKETSCLSAGKQLSHTALLLCFKVILGRTDGNRSACICCNLFDFSEIFPFSIIHCTLPQRPGKVGPVTLFKNIFSNYLQIYWTWRNDP